MTDAVRDAELLARALVAVRDGADEAVALAEYQVTRDAVSLPLLTTVDRMRVLIMAKEGEQSDAATVTIVTRHRAA